MKHAIFSLFLGASILSSVCVSSQQSSFDNDVHPWHKKAVMTCGMMRDMKTFDQQKMLASLGELDNELKPISEKYLNNTTEEYAADPLWKTYFEDLADNIRIVREKVAREKSTGWHKNIAVSSA